MTREQFVRERRYQAALSVVRGMQNARIISDGDATKLKAMFQQQYKPVIGAILSMAPEPGRKEEP